MVRAGQVSGKGRTWAVPLPPGFSPFRGFSCFLWPSSSCPRSLRRPGVTLLPAAVIVGPEGTKQPGKDGSQVAQGGSKCVSKSTTAALFRSSFGPQPALSPPFPPPRHGGCLAFQRTMSAVLRRQVSSPGCRHDLVPDGLKVDSAPE